MKRTVETQAGPSAIIRRLGFGCLSLLLVVAITAMAESNAHTKLWADAKEAGSLVVWYVQSDQWRADARTYLTYAEYLFCPRSGVECRLDLDEDE